MTIKESCKNITWKQKPQSADVFFINRDGNPDCTQFDLYWEKEEELEELWENVHEEMHADIDSVTEVCPCDGIVD